MLKLVNFILMPFHFLPFIYIWGIKANAKLMLLKVFLLTTSTRKPQSLY